MTAQVEVVELPQSVIDEINRVLGKPGRKISLASAMAAARLAYMCGYIAATEERP